MKNGDFSNNNEKNVLGIKWRWAARGKQCGQRTEVVPLLSGTGEVVIRCLKAAREEAETAEKTNTNATLAEIKVSRWETKEIVGRNTEQ